MAKARLGSTYEALSGRIGNVVASNEQDGTSLRSHNPVSKQPFTPAQLASESAFTKATQTWLTLPASTVADFDAYARTQKVRNELTGKYRTRRGRQVFVGLYAKLLQLSAAHALPVVPSGTYAGDAVSVSASAAAGKVEFSATGANAEGTTTELMAQRLPSAVALPTPDGYRTVGFAVFTARDTSVSVSLAPGYYALGYQFVDTSTGQAAGFRALAVQRVTLAVVQGGAEGGDEGRAKAA